MLIIRVSWEITAVFIRGKIKYDHDGKCKHKQTGMKECSAL